MNHESLWEVGVHDGTILCQSPQSDFSSMSLAAIVSVKIETNDLGPWGSDVWWLISSHDDALVFPSGATGEKSVLEALQSLPGFDNTTVVQAMLCTDTAMFVCFENACENPYAASSHGQ